MNYYSFKTKIIDKKNDIFVWFFIHYMQNSSVMNDISRNNWNAMSDDRILRQIGEFVKHHRMEQNKTQATLAEDAGISRSTLSLLERGDTVTVATLIRVLRVLDQLHIMDVFVVTRQQSPLALAKAERKKKQRITFPRRKKTDKADNENIDW